MAVNQAKALKVEIRDIGTQKGGQFRKRTTFYTFKCLDCPETIEVRSTDCKKVTGRCRRCGDLAGAAKTAKKIRKRPYEALYNKFVYDRRRVSKSTDLTYEDFVAFTINPHCHYCGQSVEWSEYSIGINGGRYNLDRMDNSAGYTKNNLVVCCWLCNETKGDRFSYEEFVQIGKVITGFERREWGLKKRNGLHSEVAS